MRRRRQWRHYLPGPWVGLCPAGDVDGKGLAERICSFHASRYLQFHPRVSHVVGGQPDEPHDVSACRVEIRVESDIWRVTGEGGASAGLEDWLEGGNPPGEPSQTIEKNKHAEDDEEHATDDCYGPHKTPRAL